MYNYEKKIPVSEMFDVVVCGGGPAGIGAAIAAAENGAKTALIERFGFPGGMATAGYVNPMSEFAYNGERITGGIPWRFAQELVKAGGGLVEEPRCNISFDPEKYKLVAVRMLKAAGVKLFMNSFVCDAVMDNNVCTGVIITNKSGMQLVQGHYVIDATGDADVANFAGFPMQEQIRDMQPGTLCFVLGNVDTSTERMHIMHQKNHRFNHQAVFVRETLFALREQGIKVPLFGGPWLSTTLNDGCITVNMTRAAVVATDNEDYQNAEEKMREDVFTLVDLLKKHVPEFKKCYIASVAAVTGIRESRRIKGIHTVTGQEYVETVHYEDSIARACHPVDIHLPGDEGQKLMFPKDAGYIPYRSMINADYPNIIVAGRCISADAEAFAAIRVQAPCMEIGQAAGIAASLCLQNGRIAVKDVSLNALVDKVRRSGSVI
ncbi:MAG: FAD-dependent oxidoreductase [Lentisphaeria bacterium]|nr:FAD-dependent oxidoreductase [Lentisphaeria bacterium]